MWTLLNLNSLLKTMETCPGLSYLILCNSKGYLRKFKKYILVHCNVFVFENYQLRAMNYQTSWNMKLVNMKPKWMSILQRHKKSDKGFKGVYCFRTLYLKKGFSQPAEPRYLQFVRFSYAEFIEAQIHQGFLLHRSEINCWNIWFYQWYTSCWFNF